MNKALTEEPSNPSYLLQLKADTYYYLNQIENSLEQYIKSIHATKNSEVKNLQQLQELNSHIGFCYCDLGLFTQALPYYLESSRLAQSLGDSVEMASTFYNLGTI
ncbi:MAG: tetratricopeptide (TPR) repeat protein [Cyclobacteriaceae bacterium]